MVFGGILFYRSDVHRIRKRELYEHSQCVTISSENDGKPQKANQSFSNSIVKQRGHLVIKSIFGLGLYHHVSWVYIQGQTYGSQTEFRYSKCKLFMDT